jgi:hypothetical protein
MQGWILTLMAELFLKSDWNKPLYEAIDDFQGVVPFVWFAMFLFISSMFDFSVSFLTLMPSIKIASYLIRWLGSIATIWGQVLTYIVRQWGWSVIQRRALGLEGYGSKLPRVRRVPAFVSRALFKYENMPSAVERRALQRRQRGFDRQLGLVSDMLAKHALPTDTTSLLQAIESDLSLVHAAYYTDDECIERIADWIAAPCSVAYPVPGAAGDIGSDGRR